MLNLPNDRLNVRECSKQNTNVSPAQKKPNIYSTSRERLWLSLNPRPSSEGYDGGSGKMKVHRLSRNCCVYIIRLVWLVSSWASPCRPFLWQQIFDQEAPVISAPSHMFCLMVCDWAHCRYSTTVCSYDVFSIQFAFSNGSTPESRVILRCREALLLIRGENLHFLTVRL